MNPLLTTNSKPYMEMIGNTYDPIGLKGNRNDFTHDLTLDQQLYTLHGNDMLHLKSDRLKGNRNGLHS